MIVTVIALKQVESRLIRTGETRRGRPGGAACAMVFQVWSFYVFEPLSLPLWHHRATHDQPTHLIPLHRQFFADRW